MDGRDFGPQRSVHGPPPPLLSGLAMDSHRVGAATAGRLPASGLPGPLPPGKYMAGLNLHPHPGKCPARCPPFSCLPGEIHSAGSFCTLAAGAQRFSFGWPRGPGRTRRPERGNSGPGAKANPAAERGARLGCVFPGAPGLRESKAGAVTGATGGDSNSQGPRRHEPGLEFSKSGQEKNKPAPAPRETPALRARIFFLANAPVGARGPWVLFSALPPVPNRIPGSSRAPGDAGGR
nr:collagen alpha-1(I) chain-like [Saimiri boliviensis boliviensis]